MVFVLMTADIFHHLSGEFERFYQETNVSNKSNIRSKMWSDEPSYQMAYACENEMLTINCSDEKEDEENENVKRNDGKNNPTSDSSISLEIIRANFGRFSISICNKESRADFSVNCQSHSSLDKMKNL